MPKASQQAKSPILAFDRAAALALTPVSRETEARLDRYVELLLEWQAKTNLVAPSTLPNIWTRHISDSLQLLSLAPSAKSWVDLGSGGGFPGVVLACALAETPGARIHLVERIAKKAAFLREAIRVTASPGTVHLADIGDTVDRIAGPIDCVTALAAIGERVLIVDLDPQGNASTGLGIDRRNRSCSTYDVLIGEAPLRDAVVATAVPRLHIAASTMDLSGLELELGTTPGRAFRLRDAIPALNKNAAPDTEYTYVLIDCPPSLNLLTVNAMAASDAILVPLQCEFFALEGLSQLLQTVEQVRSTLNPNLSIHGIVLTMFDSRNNLSNQVVADVRQFMGSKVYNTMIPRNVRISEAPSYGKPVLVYDLKCVGSEAYLKFATEVIQPERELRTH